MENSRIIVALKGMNVFEAVDLANKLKDRVWGFKINDLLLDGPGVINELKKNVPFIMADAKTFEIDDDMMNEVKKIIGFGADIVTVHCAADFNPHDLEISKKLVGVTVLTTFDHDRCVKIFNRSVDIQIHNFVDNVALRYGYGYVVCSAQDLLDKTLSMKIKEANVKTICPAIRPVWIEVKNDDQKRALTPAEAIRAGADYLVIGRPIVKSNDPIYTVEMINREIEEALRNPINNGE